MPTTAGLSRTLAILSCLLTAVGCPVLLKDDFQKLPAREVDGQIIHSRDSAVDVDVDGRATDGGPSCVGPSCEPQWLAMANPPLSFVSREKTAHTAFGTKVFIWGGADETGHDLATGAIYDTSADTWSDVAVDAMTPSARVLATSVWTGERIVTWGGGDAVGTVDYATGARFDPTANAWSMMSSDGAPSARRAAYGFWTGTRVLFWGGFDKAGKPVSGAYSYDPDTDTWAAASTSNQPPALLDPTIGFSGSLLLLYGGSPDGSGGTQHTYSYSPGTDTWRHLHDGMGARYGAMGTWDGSALLAWAGSVMKNEGKRYLPDADNWASISTTNAPPVRYAAHREAGWSARIGDGVVLVLGGYGSASPLTPLTDGGIYDAATDTWARVAAWPSGAAHQWGVGVFTGTEFVLWGGRANSGNPLTSLGDRFRP